jgi:hypothetical protein
MGGLLAPQLHGNMLCDLCGKPSRKSEGDVGQCQYPGPKVVRRRRSMWKSARSSLGERDRRAHNMRRIPSSSRHQAGRSQPQGGVRTGGYRSRCTGGRYAAS